MKLEKIVVGLFVCLSVTLSAETWTLEDKQGREIVVDQLFYDGVNLSVRRVGAYSKIKISPDMLSKQCWKELNRSMAKDAAIALEVVRRTKTSTDTDRSSTTGYYTYSSEEKEVKKMNFFEMKLRSSSHFVSDLAIEYFIISEEEVDCGRLSEKISFAEPIEVQIAKAISHREYSYKSSYGYQYESKSGDSKAGVVVFVRNADDEIVAEYATSSRLLDEFRGMERELRAKWKSRSGSGKKKQTGGSSVEAANQQVTIDKNLL